MGVQVGQLIGLLAEEEDDLSKIEIPTIAIPASTSPPPPASIPSASAPTASTSTLPPPTLTTPVAEPITLGSKKSHTRPSHSAPLSPSVLRLLSLHHVDDPSQIVATGKHGMLTKGDVMSFLGMITLTPSIPAPAAVTTPAREQTLNAADSMKVRLASHFLSLTEANSTHDFRRRGMRESRRCYPLRARVYAD